jgi:hypothetical protein
LTIATILYLSLPVAIFLATWFRWYVAVSALAALVWTLAAGDWRLDIGRWTARLRTLEIRHWKTPSFKKPIHLSTLHSPLSTARAAPSNSTLSIFPSPLFTLHFTLLTLAFVWTYLAGVGEFRPQHFDYFKHNLILNNLVRFDWPVRYTDGSYLCYYHAYYLPAAALAKWIGGVAMVKYYIFGWTWLGLSLLFLQLNRLGGWKLVVFFMFFNSPEAILLIYEALKSPHTIGYTLTDLWTNDHTIELLQTPGGLMFPSHVESFTAAPQHALPAWLIAVQLLKKTPLSIFHYSFFIILCLYWSPLVAVGLLPFLFINLPKVQSRPHFAFFILHFTLLIPILVFYAGHVPMHDVSGWWWTFLKSPHQYALFATFLALEVSFWAILLVWIEKKRQLFKQDFRWIWVSLGILLFCSLYRYGHFNDLARRASLPATVVLCWAVFRTLSSRESWVVSRAKFISHFTLYIILFTLFILPLKHHLRWLTKQPYTAIVDKKIADFTPYTIHYLAQYHWGEFDVVAQYLGRSNAWYNQYLAPSLPVQPKQITRAFYYWKTTFKLSDYEKQALKTHKINRLYIRLFDVDWDFATRRALPKAVVEFKQVPPLPFVPTVFMTNRTLENMTWGGIEELAEQIVKKLNPTTASEVQLDCDWTPATRTKYFRLITLMQQKMPSVLISATIRLHQIKFYRRTGVPPVKRGMLMYYNMADWQNLRTKNSILDLDVARRYADYISDYPLPLDAVLPLFGWTIVFRNNRAIKIINNLNTSNLSQNNYFQKSTNSNQFVATKNHQNFGFSVRKGDVFRVEESSPDALLISSHLLTQEIQNQSLTFAFYHLDSTNLSRHGTPPFPK